ncbi:hypothetical protein DNTS_021736 [Danionella cerebrum]|uniref:Ciliary neurotrophic factor n=1 Tax=Danionella cerebrum TaxID=2873325 RepID=A0A553NJC2_9TELE|nr:hypothetical protein DNTS_021736 [Danionella translucida]
MDSAAESDTAAPVDRSRAAAAAAERSAALARLLHRDCTLLLQRYEELGWGLKPGVALLLSEFVTQDDSRLAPAKLLGTFTSDLESLPSPPGGRLVTLAQCSGTASTAGRLRVQRWALHHCLKLLERLVLSEEEDEEEEEEESLEALRRTVRDRLSHLIHSTAELMRIMKDEVEEEPEGDCAQAEDEVEGAGGFAVKLWTFRVLHELVHWSEAASHTLHTIHMGRPPPAQEQIL